MRSLALGAIHVFAACCIAGCVHPAHYENMRHRAEAAEAETQKALTYLAGAQQDNAMLQKYALELETAIHSLQGGMILQAQETAHMRRSCDL